MSELDVNFDGALMTEGEVLRQEVGTFALECLTKHTSFLQMSEGAVCLFATRTRMSTTEVHGFVADPQTGRLEVESHFINEEDADYNVLFSHDIAGTNPDGGCEHLEMTEDGVLHRQLSSGQVLPGIFSGASTYDLLRQRLSMLDPYRKAPVFRPESKHPYVTDTHLTLPTVAELILKHKHQLYHPALRRLAGYRD